VRQVPPAVLAALESDAALVRTGISAAAPYGWAELTTGEPWVLDADVQADALRRLDAAIAAAPALPTSAVLLRVVDGLWPL
jgi:hypothetical protein